MNLELIELQSKYNEIHGIKIPLFEEKEKKQDDKQYLEKIIQYYPEGWNDAPNELKIEVLKKAIKEKKKITDVTNYFTEGVYFE